LSISNQKQTAHLASALSIADILAVLLNSFLKIDPSSKVIMDDNHLILSKGHAALALYSALYNQKMISWEELRSFSEPGSEFEEHPNPKIPTVDFPTGSLGHGLPLGVGLALANKLQGNSGTVFVLMSDGECNEGTVWEAAQFAHAKKIDNLIVFVDHNGFQATGETSESLGAINLGQVFDSFGWNTETINGNNAEEVSKATKSALHSQFPTAIIANTVKGRGVSFMEHNNNWHYRAPNDHELKQALSELGIR